MIGTLVVKGLMTISFKEKTIESSRAEKKDYVIFVIRHIGRLEFINKRVPFVNISHTALGHNQKPT